jgi:hypothetical protein
MRVVLAGAYELMMVESADGEPVVATAACLLQFVLKVRSSPHSIVLQ